MIKRLLLLGFVFLQSISYAQQDAWIYLTDKENVTTSIQNPLTILTQEAINRKNAHGVVIDERDVPVNESYISQLKGQTGITVMSKSKWFNAVHVRGSETDINALMDNLAFVDAIDFADKSLNTTSRMVAQNNKFEIEDVLVDFVYNNTQNQVEMINADDLHVLDYTGSGVIVAVIDAGFPGVNTIGGFQRLRDAGNLLGGYDFVDRTVDVYASASSDHGTKVLSTMAGYIENQFVGTAPDARYYVFRTEDAASENPVEESYWVEAAERADSLGVRIINSSLGYKDYNNVNYSYSSSDLDGNTAYITKAANIAFEKGMLLICSAGNSGASGVAAPADAAGVLSVGAVDADGNYATFSSQGSAIQPTQKPDVVAQGQGSNVIDSSNNIVANNGTSFSSPIMAGGITCLLQALPNTTNAEIMQFIRESASQYNTPDYLLGYGIPDLLEALNLTLIAQGENILNVRIFPNPVSDGQLNIRISSSNEQINLIIYDVLGKAVLEKTITSPLSRIDLSSMASGIYMMSFQSGKMSKKFKLLKS